MENQEGAIQTTDQHKQNLPKQIFTDLEAKRNLVGFFELLIKVDKRNNPENYTL